MAEPSLLLMAPWGSAEGAAPLLRIFLKYFKNYFWITDVLYGFQNSAQELW